VRSKFVNVRAQCSTFALGQPFGEVWTKAKFPWSRVGGLQLREQPTIEEYGKLTQVSPSESEERGARSEGARSEERERGARSEEARARRELSSERYSWNIKS